MQIIELAAKLQSVGFSDKQAKVYVAVLFLGPSSVQKIASQAEINRATCYVILEDLMQMGLVSESTQGKKTVYVAEPPEAIRRYLEAQSKALATKKDELRELMPELSKTSRATDGEDAPVVRFYKGLEGSEQLSKELLRKAKKGETIYGVTNYDEWIATDTEKKAANTRVKKGVKAKSLYYSHDTELKASEIRLNYPIRVNKNFQTEINLYQNRASFITYGGEDTVGVLIESAKIVETLRQLFELAFEKNRQ